MITSEFSALSDLKWHESRIGEEITYTIDKRFKSVTEYWEDPYPTRSNTSTIDTCKEILPIFGDSFMFCSGVPRQFEISHTLRTIYPKITFLNLSKPGSSNAKIVTRIEQWANEERSKKTKTIIVGLTSMYRHDYYMDTEHPIAVSPHNSVYEDKSKHYLRGYDIMAQVSPNELIGREGPKIRNKAQHHLSKVWASMIDQHTSYVNSFIKNYEINLRRIDWITKAMNWNVIYIDTGMIGDATQHDYDKKCINKYLQDMDISTRKFKVIRMVGNHEIVDKLDCGHYGLETIKNMAKLIREEYDGI